MHRADKAVLRLASGLGVAVLIAYGLSLPAPFVACVMTVILLCKSGPPIPLGKGAVLAVLVGVIMVAGVLMVPLLEHFRLAGLALIGLLLFAVFSLGARSPGPLSLILAIALTVIPVAGVAEQALVTVFSIALAVGLGTGVFVGAIAHALFPDPPDPHMAAGTVAAPEPVAPLPAAAVRSRALRATLIVMPVFVLALTNPSLYLAAIIKTVALGQQASAVTIRSAGRDLVGSTLAGAAMAAVVWGGLTLRPNLWMLLLWLVAAALWSGARLFRVRATALPPAFWSNALVTMLILLGPAIEDSANGKDVYAASAVRVTLFMGISLYAWAMVALLDRWSGRTAQSEPPEVA